MAAKWVILFETVFRGPAVPECQREAACVQVQQRGAGGQISTAARRKPLT